MKRIIPVILIAVLAIAVVVGAIKLVTSIIAGAFNALLGIGVIAALIIIVIWMFAYARKKRQ